MFTLRETAMDIDDGVSVYPHSLSFLAASSPIAAVDPTNASPAAPEAVADGECHALSVTLEEMLQIAALHLRQSILQRYAARSQSLSLSRRLFHPCVADLRRRFGALEELVLQTKNGLVKIRNVLPEAMAQRLYDIVSCITNEVRKSDLHTEGIETVLLYTQFPTLVHARQS